MFIYVAISGSGEVIALFFAATLGSLTVRTDTIFEIVVTLYCITLGGVSRGVATFLVTVGVT